MATQKCAVACEICKQPSESYLLGADFSQVLEEGEYILVGTSEVTAVDNDGNDSTDDVLDNDDMAVDTADEDDLLSGTTPITNGMLVTRILGGDEDLSKYKITFLVQTSNGNTYEKDVLMRIKDN
jgi:hypothetical protein